MKRKALANADPAGWPIRIISLFYREAGLTYEARPHTHSMHQWYFVLHGTVNTRVDGVRHVLHAEESMIVRPGAVRDRASGERAPGYFVAGFENRGLALDDVAHRVLTLPDDLRPDLHALVAEIRRPGASNANELIAALAVRLLVGLRRAHRAAVVAPGGERMSPLSARYRDEVVSQAEAYMRLHLPDPVTRADMAAAVHLSAPHLARVFRQATGKTLGKRLAELRIEQAKSLLLESDVPITTIALDVGFASFSHFARLFRREVGVVPSDYRRSGGHAWVDAQPRPSDPATREQIQHMRDPVYTEKSVRQRD